MNRQKQVKNIANKKSNGINDIAVMPLTYVFGRHFKHIIVPSLFLLPIASLLYIAAAAGAQDFAHVLWLCLFAPLSVICIIYVSRINIMSFKAELPRKSARGVMPGVSMRRKIAAAHLLSSAIGTAIWAVCVFLSLFLLSVIPEAFGEAEFLISAVTSTVFVFIVTLLDVLTFPLLISLMCFCSVAYVRRIKPKKHMSPALIAFLPIYALTLTVTIVIFLLTSFLNISFLTSFVGDAAVISHTVLWLMLLTLVLNVGFGTAYFFLCAMFMGRAR